MGMVAAPTTMPKVMIGMVTIRMITIVPVSMRTNTLIMIRKVSMTMFNPSGDMTATHRSTLV
jgi:hypothetical protein